MPDLFAPEDLTGLPGAPFDAEVVTQAGEAIRNACGWHIAPELTETLTVDSAGGTRLYLKTKLLTNVTAVRDVTNGGSTILTGWTFNRLGRLTRRSGWPCDGHTLEVDVVHGYEECPVELLGVGATIARGLGDSRLAKQKSLGSASLTYETDAVRDLAPSVLDAYTILTV